MVRPVHHAALTAPAAARPRGAPWLGPLFSARWQALVTGVLLTAWIAPTAADSLRGEVLRCAELMAPDARLACFDAVAATLRTPAEPGRASSAETSEPLAPPAAAPEEPVRARQDFGRDSMPANRSADGEPGADAIDATIVAVRQRPRGEHVFELDNGQTWTESSPGRAPYQAGMAVRIERTTLGAYMLSTPGGRATRVRRLQ